MERRRTFTAGVRGGCRRRSIAVDDGLTAEKVVQKLSAVLRSAWIVCVDRRELILIKIRWIGLCNCLHSRARLPPYLSTLLLLLLLVLLEDHSGLKSLLLLEILLEIVEHLLLTIV